LGDLFFPVISLAVSVILFEGALTLNWAQVQRVAGPVRRLLTMGALVTWFGSAAAARYIMGLSWSVALLFGALIIVTGPTVIAPLLSNVRPTAGVASVLKWEGILIDPIGALIAVLVLDVLLAQLEPTAAGMAWAFLWPNLLGVGLGVAGGALAYWTIHRFLIPDYLRDIAVLALVMVTFAAADALAHESGLVAVTAMGVFLANTDLKKLHEILYFKEKLTILLVSVLFILLAANVTVDDLRLLDWRAFAVLAAVMFVVRPLGVFLTTLGSSLSRNERLFLAWIAPRGIVAAAVTSLFVFELRHSTVLDPALARDAAILGPLVFLIIAGTVFIQGGTAKLWARRLGVSDADPQGFLIMGANPVARALGRALALAGVPVRLVDFNRFNVEQAQAEGLSAQLGDMLSDFVESDLDLAGLGRLLALTSNDEANALACQHFEDQFGSAGVYQLAPHPAKSGQASPFQRQAGRILFAPDATYRTVMERLARGAAVKLVDAGALPSNGTAPDDGQPSAPLLLMKIGRDGKVAVATAEQPPNLNEAARAVVLQ
jgi:NhaP-type Na+/H+ or K+/H+ antiporter